MLLAQCSVTKSPCQKTCRWRGEAIYCTSSQHLHRHNGIVKDRQAASDNDVNSAQKPWSNCYLTAKGLRGENQNIVDFNVWKKGWTCYMENHPFLFHPPLLLHLVMRSLFTCQKTFLPIGEGGVLIAKWANKGYALFFLYAVPCFKEYHPQGAF